MDDPHVTGTEGKGHQMTVVHKLMLNAELLGMEAALNFQQIYTVPMLQMFGTPLSLSYITGLASCPSSFLLLPLLGWLIDRGDNPQRRKFASIVFATALQVLGVLCLLFGNTLHLLDLLEYNATISTESGTLNDSSCPDLNVSVRATEAEGEGNRLDPEGHVDSLAVKDSSVVYQDSSVVPLKAGMAMLGFILMDLGFDCSNSFVKALMVTCSARADHTSLFMMGVIMGSVGGVLNAGLGVLDFTSLLGLSSVDGAKLTIQTSVQGLCIVMIVCLGFLSTFCTGRKQLRELRENGWRTASTKIHEEKHRPGSTEPHENGSPTIFRKNCKSSLDLEQDTTRRSHFVQRALEDSIRSFEGSSVYVDPPPTLLEEHSPSFAEDVPLLEEKGTLREDHEDGPPMTSRSVGSCYGSVGCEARNHEGASLSRTPMEGAGEWTPVDGRRCGGSCRQNPKVRIFLACLTLFFSMDTVVTFGYSVSDFVSKAVYDGDPTGDPGSDALNNYQAGIQMASWALLVYFIAYLATSIANPRIVALLGFRVEFILLQLLMVITMLLTALTSRLETVFLLSVVAGIHRTCIYTIPYAVINDAAQTIVSAGNNRSPVGLSMSLAAACLPLSYCALFTWVGAVEELTGDVSTPLFLGSAAGAIGIVVFLFLGKA